MNSDAPKITLVGSFNNYYTLTGKTSLHEATARGSIIDIKSCLENNANINAIDRYGNTPLHYAITNQNKDATILLIEQGANATIRNHDGLYPMQLLYNWDDEGKKINPPPVQTIFKNTVLAAIIYHKAVVIHLEEL